MNQLKEPFLFLILARSVVLSRGSCEHLWITFDADVLRLNLRTSGILLGMSRTLMGTGEWYHCYNRGVDKRCVFESTSDYERFLVLLYLCNGTKNVRPSDRRDPTLQKVLKDTSIDRGKPLVEVGAYSLMPNHPHLILREIHPGGIAIFIQKMFTGYTMYFNLKNTRTGSLFAGSYKARHVDDDTYAKHLIAYVLLNPVELFEPEWKSGIGDVNFLEKKLTEYPYSSLPDFFGIERLENKIVSKGLQELYDELPTLKDLLNDFQAYYREHLKD